MKPTPCCNNTCSQGRDCPQRQAQVLPKRAAKPLRLAHDVLDRGTRRSAARRFKAFMRDLWRYLSGPSPW